MSASTVSSPIGHSRTQFGTAIFELRTSRGLTQRQLAKLSGLQASAISDIENLRRPPPRPEQVKALSRALANGEEQGQALYSLACQERRATHGLRIGRHTPRRVAALLRDIAISAEHLTDRHVAALRAQLREAADM